MAHLRESGRILSLFCEMSAAPKIVGLHGTGPVVLPGTAEWTEHAPRFEPQAGPRTIVLADIQRVGDSCGFGVPKSETVRQRRGLTMWSESKGHAGRAQYREEKNRKSIDGLPGQPPWLALRRGALDSDRPCRLDTRDEPGEAIATAESEWWVARPVA